MTQFDKLIAYTEALLSPAGFELSKYGKDEMRKRFNASVSNGGYSEYWHKL